MLLTIDSAGAVLSLFSRSNPERGATEVALALGVSKSKAHSLLISLTAVGLLRRTQHGRYRLGWRLLALNQVLFDTTDFRAFTGPVLQQLAQHTGELLHLSVLDGGQVVFVDRVEGRHAVSIDASAVGNRAPAHCTAVGKVLLAHQTPDGLSAAIERHGLPRLTTRTITDRRALEAELEGIRRRGFATELGEAMEGLACIAAPIVSPGPSVVAALSIAAPSNRLAARRDVYLQAVVRAGTYVSRCLLNSREELAERQYAGIDHGLAEHVTVAG